VHVTWGVVLLGLKFGFDFGDLLGLGFSILFLVCWAIFSLMVLTECES
jgi:hypothetical protein